MTLKLTTHPKGSRLMFGVLALLVFALIFVVHGYFHSFAWAEAQEPNEGPSKTSSLNDDNQEASALSSSLLRESITRTIKMAAGLDLDENAQDYTVLLRLYNRWTLEHFYTASTQERDELVSRGWTFEGEGWRAPLSSSKPVYRLYNSFDGDHHYTMNNEESGYLISIGWTYEGIGWYSAEGDEPAVALYREFNPYEKTGTHNFTLNSAEHCGLVDRGWRPEGAAWFALPSSEALQNGWIFRDGQWRYRIEGQEVASRWVVTETPAPTALLGSGMARYWIDSNAALAMNRRLWPNDVLDRGCEFEAFATAGGNVERNNTFLLEGIYYKANNDGKIEKDEVVNRLVSMAQQYSSSSKYLLMVDIDDPKTMVFEGSKGNWKVKYIWDCCTGAPSTPTITGVFRVGIKGYSFGENHGYSCYYYTQFSGNYLFHTRKYYPRSREILDGRMGERVSEGCVRLYDENAIWIQKNVPAGTTVVSTN